MVCLAPWLAYELVISVRGRPWVALRTCQGRPPAFPYDLLVGAHSAFVYMCLGAGAVLALRVLTGVSTPADRCLLGARSAAPRVEIARASALGAGAWLALWSGTRGFRLGIEAPWSVLPVPWAVGSTVAVGAFVLALAYRLGRPLEDG